MSDSPQDGDARIASALRELALVDRIIGLEAEVARLSIEGGIHDLRILHRSRAWRVGRIVLSPYLVFRKLIHR